MSKTLRDILKGTKRRRKSGIYRSLKDGDLANPIQLDEFLDGVGSMMKLPPRELPREEEKKKAEQTAAASPRKWARLVLALSAVILIPLALQREPPQVASAPLPAGVLGIWSTDDPRYSNRTFEIGSGHIAFKHGDRADDQSLHQIAGVEAVQMGDSSLFRIKYLEAGGTYELEFKFSRFPKPGIRFTHQEEFVWRPAMEKPVAVRRR